MGSRLFKQIIFSAGYLIIFGFLIFGFYYIWFKPAPSCFDNKQNQNETGVDCGGPCGPCAIKNLIPPKASLPRYFSTDHQTIIAVEVQNPNPNYGADTMVYNLNIYGNDGNQIKSIKRDSLIYSGEIKYIIEPVDIDYKDIGQIKIDFSNINWKSKDDFPTPDIQTRAVIIEAGTNGAGPNVNGFITNNNPFSLSKARIISLLFNQSGIEISASKTELDNLSAFEERPFQINFPKDISLGGSSSTLKTADPTKTKIYVEAIR